MENKNEIIEENNFDKNKDLNQDIDKDISNNVLINIEIKNRKFIEEIFKYSNELIPIFKENSDKNIIDFFNFLIQISNKKNLNEEEVKLICHNLKELKQIF